jgi:hypothetical protein
MTKMGKKEKEKKKKKRRRRRKSIFRFFISNLVRFE